MRTLLALALVLLGSTALAQAAESADVSITSGGRAYRSFVSVGEGPGRKPGVVLLHSFNGLEQGYRDLTEDLAAEGYVVLALGWQTFERQPSDATVLRLVQDGLAYLKRRGDVNAERLGLTGFCAGGRYTMLFLPQLRDLKAGVAWYGFPYQGQPTRPVDLIRQLTAPLLIIHGTRDQPSKIEDIYRYATALDAANRYFELKIYQGQPHGFYLENGRVAESAAAKDARDSMLLFFDKTLK